MPRSRSPRQLRQLEAGTGSWNTDLTDYCLKNPRHLPCVHLSCLTSDHLIQSILRLPAAAMVLGCGLRAAVSMMHRRVAQFTCRKELKRLVEDPEVAERLPRLLAHSPDPQHYWRVS